MLRVEVERLQHTGRAKDVLRNILRERHFRDLFDNGAAEDEGRVDIFVSRTGLEVQVVERGKIGHGQCFVSLDLHFTRNAAAGIRDTRRVGEEMLDLDVLPERGLVLRKIL